MSPLLFLTSAGIESSCDETGAAVVSLENGLGSVVADKLLSQWALHERHGGVVPNIAAREHKAHITKLIGYALQSSASISSPQSIWQGGLSSQSIVSDPRSESDVVDADEISGSVNIDAIAIASGPGLAPCLKVGLETAKRLAKQWNKPLIPVNHIEAHALIAQLTQPDLAFPFLALVVSGGHSQLFWAKALGDYEVVGSTIDDAAGEAYDKSFKLANVRTLDLGRIKQIVEKEKDIRFDMLSKYSEQIRTADRDGSEIDFIRAAWKIDWEVENERFIDEIQSVPDLFVQPIEKIDEYPSLTHAPSAIGLFEGLVPEKVQLEASVSPTSVRDGEVKDSSVLYQDSSICIDASGTAKVSQEDTKKRAQGAIVEDVASLYMSLSEIVLGQGTFSLEEQEYRITQNHENMTTSLTTPYTKMLSRSQLHHTDRTQTLNQSHPLLRPLSFQVPLSSVHSTYSYTSFSFSGLKTQVRNHVVREKEAFAKAIREYTQFITNSNVNDNDAAAQAPATQKDHQAENASETKMNFDLGNASAIIKAFRDREAPVFKHLARSEVFHVRKALFQSRHHVTSPINDDNGETLESLTQERINNNSDFALSNIFRLGLCAQFQDTLLRHVSLVAERGVWYLHHKNELHAPDVEALDASKASPELSGLASKVIAQINGVPVTSSDSSRRPAMNRLVICGGVAANQTLCNHVRAKMNKYNFKTFVAPLRHCTDNGVMIAWAGALKMAQNPDQALIQDFDELDFKPRWPVGPHAFVNAPRARTPTKGARKAMKITTNV